MRPLASGLVASNLPLMLSDSLEVKVLAVALNDLLVVSVDILALRHQLVSEVIHSIV